MKIIRICLGFFACSVWLSQGLAAEVVERIYPADIPSTEYGTDLDYDGATLVVGDPAFIAEAEEGEDAGGVHVYTRENGAWEVQDLLRPEGLVTDDLFGSAVAVDGDTIIASAPEADSTAGRVYVFTNTEEGWSDGVLLTYPDLSSNDEFGVDLAIQGDTIFVGATRDDFYGAVVIFTRNGSGDWIYQTKLAISDFTTFRFGEGLAVDGDTLLIGAPGAIKQAGVSGAVFAYTGSGASWTLQQEILPSLLDAEVAMDFGLAIAMDGDRAIIGAPGANSQGGAAFITDRAEGVWAEPLKLLPGDGGDSDFFGSEVALRGDRALVSGTGHIHSTEGGDPFAVRNSFYTYELIDESWQQVDEELGPFPRAGITQDFGRSLFLGDEHIFAGPFDDGVSVQMLEYEFIDSPEYLHPAYNPLGTIGVTGATVPTDVARFEAPESNNNVVVESLADGSDLNNLGFFNESWVVVAMATMADGNADDEANDPLIAVLATNPSTGQHKVQFRDPVSGAAPRANMAFLNSGYTVVDVAIIPDTDGNGISEDPSVAVLGTKTENGRNLIEIYRYSDDSLVGRYAVFNPNWTVKSLAVAYEGGLPRLGVLATSLLEGHSVIDQRLVSDGSRLGRVFFFGQYIESESLAAYVDVDGPGAGEGWAWLVQGKKYFGNNIVRARRVADGAKEKDLTIISDVWNCKGLSVLPDQNANMFDDLVSLCVIPDNNMIMKLRDFDTGDSLGNIYP